MRILLLFILFSSSTIFASAELVAAGKVSSIQGEHSPTFDVLSNELVFMRRTPGKFDYTLYTSKLTGDSWSKPKVMPFSGNYRDGGAYFSPNGQSIVFDSRRPTEKLKQGSINLWQSNRLSASQWSEPKLLEKASANTATESVAGSDEFGPLLTSSGDLWFYSFRQPLREGAYYRQMSNGQLVRDTQLPDPSANTFIAYLSLSKDMNTAVIEGRSQKSRDTDLYYACRVDGEWGPAIPLSKINTSAGEGTPFLTADSKWLWFASDRKTDNANSVGANIYRISTTHLPIPCD